jgi:hypothetical protein
VVSNEPMLKIKAATAAEVCTHFQLDLEPRSMLRDAMSPREFLAALIAGKQPLAGIDFIAHALPPRDAIWWGCLCLQHACGSDLSVPDKAACKAAVRWVLQPTEENRAAANAPAEAAGPVSPTGGLASAAFHTGGNIAPPKTPPVSPRPFDPAKAVARAIKLASTKAEPAKMVDTQRLFVELGIGIAEGRFVIIDAKNVTAVR